MKIAIDIMGGDYAPREILLGAMQFAQTGMAGLILVGCPSEIGAFSPGFPSNCEVVETSEFVEMGEPPSQALRRKRKASVALAARLVKEGRAQAFLSAGNTGAQVAASLLEIGRITGIERPGVSIVYPTINQTGVVILDVGANVDCDPNHLLQYAMMGSVYFEKIFKVESPKVGLLNVGSEVSKGNALAKKTFALLGNSNLNFIGNIEADHLIEGNVDVLVCDGFVGNVLLKASESISEVVVKTIREGVSRAKISPKKAMEIFSGLQRFQADSPEYSGAPLLGINGCAIVCHGKSKATVIANAIHLAVKYVSEDVVGVISQRLPSLLSKKIS